MRNIIQSSPEVLLIRGIIKHKFPKVSDNSRSQCSFVYVWDFTTLSRFQR